MAENSSENSDSTMENPSQSTNENGASANREEYEDWDKMRENGASSPSKEHPDSSDASDKADGEEPYQSVGRSAGRSLAQLMSPRALKGQDILLSEDEEQRLTEELGKWVCKIVFFATSLCNEITSGR